MFGSLLEFMLGMLSLCSLFCVYSSKTVWLFMFALKTCRHSPMMLERVSQKILYYIVVGVMVVAILISNCSIVTFIKKNICLKKIKGYFSQTLQKHVFSSVCLGL